MTIRIARGPRGDASPFLFFYGSTSNGSSAPNEPKLVSNILASVNLDDPNGVDVTDSYASIGAGNPIYDILDAPYDEWEDLEGNTFASASDVVNYINTLATTMTDNVITRISAPVSASSTITVSQNAQFTHSVYQNGVTGYFWDPGAFPNGVSVLEGDRRKITGIITQTGSYTLPYEAGSISGITSNILTIDVV